MWASIDAMKMIDRDDRLDSIDSDNMIAPNYCLCHKNCAHYLTL